MHCSFPNLMKTSTDQQNPMGADYHRRRRSSKDDSMNLDDWINLAFGCSIIVLPVFSLFHYLYAPGKWIYEKVADDLAKEKEEKNRKRQEEKGNLIKTIYEPTPKTLYEPVPVVGKRPRLQR